LAGDARHLLAAGEVGAVAEQALGSCASSAPFFMRAASGGRS